MSLGPSTEKRDRFALLTGLVVAASVAAPRGARAQARDPVAAEALFDDARRLMDGGRYAEACPKLEASQGLDPAVGTLLNLGDCFEKVGKTASAWERFREAAAAAAQSGQTAREEEARGRAAALEPRLCRLAVRVPPASDAPGLALERDHAPFGRALWNEPLPADPGAHDVVASGPGKKPWSGTATLDPATCAGTTATVDVPLLADESPGAPAAALAPGNPAEQPRPAMTRWGIERELALAGGGLGLALLGAGIGLAADASSTYAGAKSRCNALGCPPPAQKSAGDAGQLADFATAAFVAGGVVLAGSGLLWFFARERPVKVDVTVGARGGALVLRGALP